MKQLHVFTAFCLNKTLRYICLLLYFSAALCVSVPPTLLGSDEVRTLMVPINGHLTLECRADSDPAPEIEWFKDEAKVQVLDQKKKAMIKKNRSINIYMLTEC